MILRKSAAGSQYSLKSSAKNKEDVQQRVDMMPRSISPATNFKLAE